MFTVRQIERLWTAKAYEKLLSELTSGRANALFGFESDLCRAVPIAALTLIRLDELSQSQVPLYGRVVRTLLAMQEPDGGWGDVITTALCVRALLCGRGQGVAIDRGITFLANLQKDEGIWPAVPMRRMPADARVSAFVLYQLGDQPQFTESVRLADAIAWLAVHSRHVDADTLGLWQRTSWRCGARNYAKSPSPLFATAVAPDQN